MENLGKLIGFLIFAPIVIVLAIGFIGVVIAFLAPVALVLLPIVAVFGIGGLVTVAAG